MSLTAVELCARALLKIGANRIGSFVETTLEAEMVPSGKWLELEGGVISGLFNQPGPALARRGRSRHDDG